MNKYFEHCIQIPLQDIDAAGVVFFAHLFRYAHETYEQFMREIGFPLAQIIRDGEFHLPLVHAEADYQQAIRHGEELVIVLRVDELSDRRFNLAYQCMDASGKQRASIRTVHVAAAVDGTGSSPLPVQLQRALQAYIDSAK